ncbi:TonB-dependent receptor plug domain-containing protein [Aquabacterium sp.]|uniref:TonB-dependent receptor plug domain-containing protein n=1 Tax=Aquabacterium sp. TaxID=1872578 RepID=UPI002BF0E74E|nr:TonB-dependent receptor [Aquabacterium sp.]HSW07514.1 TonB-dependent receptor [Aquabacterium sp.]
MKRRASRLRPAARRGGLAALLLCGGSGAWAQAADAVVPQQVQITGPATASDTELRRREPVAKTIYGREELDKYGDTAVSDVLKRLPGVSLQGGNPRLRGLGAGYTLVLINGEPAPPGFSLDNLSPSQVERIEVTKGPTAEHSAQAVGGTINIILRDAPRQRQRELRTGLGYNAVRPVPSFTATYGDRLGDLSVSLPLSGFQWRSASNSWGERRSRDVNGDPQFTLFRREDTDWGGGLNFGPRLNWRLSDSDSLNWQTFMQGNRFNSSGRVMNDVREGEPPISVDDAYRNEGHWQMLRTNLQLVRRWPDGMRLDVKAGVQASASHFDTVVNGLDAQALPTLERHSSGDNRERGWSSSGKLLRPVLDSHTLALGWDIDARRRREVRSVMENGRPQLIGFDGEPFRAAVERQALYLQDEWAIGPQWSSYLGLRGERIATTSRSSSDELRSRSSVLTPLLHLNYKLDPKGRDLLRGSLTRSYRAPDTGALLGRPSINASFPLNTTNPQIAPDRVGNPALKPELATGIDMAFEKYFAGGGLMSIGGFHRRITGLMRNQVTLETPSWAYCSPTGDCTPRWVSRPVNLQRARTSGLEFEVKGRAAELLSHWMDAGLALDVRASFSLYRSRVDGIPRPDNRLESQQPYALNLGFDHVMKTVPLTWGASLFYTPAYRVQQTVAQGAEQGVARALDVYALWTFSRQAALRVAANNLAPLDTISRTALTDEQGFTESSYNRRHNHANFQASLTLKF